ncbi:TadE/TadG family type IV pilus assembly protein [Streptomyces sp. CB02460]|uniref:TadE/TadG family type IV pilus assembly protein n=1 Tax=Streptomyces sp. CB02460 TaxID=1703941 RepID=UPI0018FE5B61|nr:TadE/TadG family type IV pilus assembly protein [Streptomyces sp. CB02460]
MNLLRADVRRDTRSDRGQTAIEFVGTLPLILLTLALLWQAGLVCYTYILAGNAADKAVRAAAVAEGSQAAACARAIREDVPGGWSAHVVSCGGSGELVSVKVRVDVPLLFPGAFSVPMHATGEASARNERRDTW